MCSFVLPGHSKVNIIRAPLADEAASSGLGEVCRFAAKVAAFFSDRPNDDAIFIGQDQL